MFISVAGAHCAHDVEKDPGEIIFRNKQPAEQTNGSLLQKAAEEANSSAQ